MKKIFLKLFVFALVLSLFAPMLGAEAADSKRNPISLNWELQRDIGGVKVYVAIAAKHADVSTQRSNQNLWAFWMVVNGSGQEIQLEIKNRVYKTSEGETRPKNNWTIQLKPGEATEKQFLSHLWANDWVARNPNAKVHSVEFNTEAKNARTGKPLTQAGILGEWEQKINNRPIARKEIYSENGVLRIKYLWLATGGGGKYSALTKEADGSYSFTEDYGDHTGIHNIKLINENSIQGTQRGRSRSVSYNYEMTRIQSTAGATQPPTPKSTSISGTYRVALIGDSTGIVKSDPNYATITITDNGNKITSDWLHNVTNYNRQTGDLTATGATHSGGRPSVVRLKFTISGSDITAVGTETRYYKGGLPGVYRVKLTRISK